MPPVRSIAAEFGTSPSTVSRALQEMMRSGWLEVHERQFVRVRRKLAANTTRRADLQRTIRSIAHKWKLWGGEEETLVRMIVELCRRCSRRGPVLFSPSATPTISMSVMGRRLAEGLNGAPLARSLIADLDRRELQRSSAVVLVPYYHYAEVKAIVGRKVPIVPVHTFAHVDTLDKLLTIPAGARVLIVGHNKRSVERLSGMVRDYADDVAITGLTINDAAKVKKLCAVGRCGRGGQGRCRGSPNPVEPQAPYRRGICDRDVGSRSPPAAARQRRRRRVGAASSEAGVPRTLTIRLRRHHSAELIA